MDRWKRLLDAHNVAATRGFTQPSVLLGLPVGSGWHHRRGDEVVDTAVAGARRAGGHQDLGETLAWELSHPHPGPHGAGVRDEEERSLLNADVTTR